MFHHNPSNFTITEGSGTVTIDWTLTDFTTDPSVKGHLYLEKYNSSGYLGSHTITDDSMKPTILHDISINGPITLTGSEDYKCFILFEKNGWERSSVIKTLNI
jgi:hypothetical protein